MRHQFVTKSREEAKPPLLAAGNLGLMRKCACGGTCKECSKSAAVPSASNAEAPIFGEGNGPALRQPRNHRFDEIPLLPGFQKNQPAGAETRTFAMNEDEPGTVDPEGGESITSTCCPNFEGQDMSSRDKFNVFDRGPLPDLGGTQARYKFEYDGATDDTGPFCQCNCCAFVQFVRGFFEINGARRSHVLPGSGNVMSATTFDQDSPIIPHAACRVAKAGGGLLNDTPGSRGILPTDVLKIHLEFDARTIDTCNSNNIVASRMFTLDITGAHPRTLSVTGDVI